MSGQLHFSKVSEEILGRESSTGLLSAAWKSVSVLNFSDTVNIHSLFVYILPVCLICQLPYLNSAMKIHAYTAHSLLRRVGGEAPSCVILNMLPTPLGLYFLI